MMSLPRFSLLPFFSRVGGVNRLEEASKPPDFLPWRWMMALVRRKGPERPATKGVGEMLKEGPWPWKEGRVVEEKGTRVEEEVQEEGGGGGGDGGEGEEKEQGRGTTWSKGRKRMSGKDWKAYQAERKKNKREKERQRKEEKACGGGDGSGGGGGQNASGGGGASSSTGQEGEEGGAAGGRMRRKVAILFGYSGTAYSGLQKNPGQKTIEDELEKVGSRTRTWMDQRH